jgi:hypothetical protein
MRVRIALDSLRDPAAVAQPFDADRNFAEELRRVLKPPFEYANLWVRALENVAKPAPKGRIRASPGREPWVKTGIFLIRSPAGAIQALERPFRARNLIKMPVKPRAVALGYSESPLRGFMALVLQQPV